MLRISRASGHKHETIQQAIRSFTIITLLANLAIPMPALAFEGMLTPVSATLLATVTQEAKVSDTVIRTGLTDSYSAHSAIGTSSPITVPSKLSKKRTEPRVVPTQDAPFVLEGTASYYSRAGCLGCNPLRIMANGQPLDDNALTMAIGANNKHLVGHTARVTNTVTNQSTLVTITDTGGFYAEKYGNRVADLTIATKQAIGMRGGLGSVRVEVF